jgi:hypothetical protein
MFKKTFLAVVLVVALAFMVSGCGQDSPKVEVKSDTEGSSEAHRSLPEGHPPMPSDNEALKFRDSLAGMGGGGQAVGMTSVSTGGSMSAKGKDVRLSDALRAKWSTIELEVSENGQKTVIKVKVGEKIKVGAVYSVLVDVFIPEYAMYEDYIGTRGDEPKNPAIRVELFEGDKSLARGWVFKNLADFNSYQEEKLGVVLLTPRGS